MSSEVTGLWPVRVTAWRNLVRVTRPQFTVVPPHGVRGDVCGLSRGSRRRLALAIAEANTDPDLFVTLTYGEKYPSVREAKEDLRVWWQATARHLSRKGLRAAMVWRLELQERGAPHFHLLIWHAGQPRESLALSLPGYSGRTAQSHLASMKLQGSGSRRVRPGSRLDWLLMLSALWYGRCDAFARASQRTLLRAVDVRSVRDRRAVAGYVSKYMAKSDRGPGTPARDPRMVGGGRVWGLRGDQLLLDRRSLVCLVAERTGDLDHGLCDAFEAEGMEWAAVQYRDGRAGYCAFIPSGSFWPLVDHWVRLFCGRPRTPITWAGGFSPT